MLDTIIIGQGIAGSILAYRLIQRGLSVLVIDNNYHGSSSKVAAGIINPITGSRLTNNELFAGQQTCSYEFYEELEQLFGQQLIEHLDQFRLLQSQEQVDQWNKRNQHKPYNAFTGEHTMHKKPFIKNEFGVVEIKSSARVYVSELLARLKNWLIEKNAYLDQKVNHADIVITDNTVSIGPINARNIIFCEGYQATYNPWWKHLPFKLSKGEILSVRLNQEIYALLCWPQWLLPQHGKSSNTALLGATYAWGDFSQPENIEPTEEAKNYLMARLEINTQLKAEVIEQKAGIRPTPTHRFPYIGSHTKNKNVYCFNGFGSKGCLTIPYYSQIMADHLIDNKPLPSDVTRYL